MKKFFVLLAVSLAALCSLTGCWNAAGRDLKILMIADGDFNDNSFNQCCSKGLKKAVCRFGAHADFEVIDNMTRLDDALDGFAAQDYDLIIANGYLFSQALYDAAQRHPELKFVLVDYAYAEAPANMYCLVFNADEAAFPLGYLGAAWADLQDSDNAAIASVGGMDIPTVRQWSDPFCNGAAYYNSSHGKQVACYGSFATDFYDADQGTALADGLIDSGADVLLGAGGLAGTAALAAAQNRGKWGIGVDMDMYKTLEQARDSLLCSGIKRYDKGVYAAVQSLVEQKFEGGGIYRGSLANGGIMLAPYHAYAYAYAIPSAVRKEISDIIQGIQDGSIATGW